MILSEPLPLFHECSKLRGMGELPIHYGLSTQMDNDAYHHVKKVEEDISKVIQDALALAKTTLREEKALLLQMANYLSDNRVLKQKEIIEMLHQYKSDKLVIPTGKEHKYYRKKLKELVKNLETESQSLGTELPYYQLNKEA
jgi:predicted XRE-type DNA-binding protein